MQYYQSYNQILNFLTDNKKFIKSQINENWCNTPDHKLFSYIYLLILLIVINKKSVQIKLESDLLQLLNCLFVIFFEFSRIT